MKKKKFNVERWRTPDGYLTLMSWARDGLSYDQISEKLGIHSTTLQKIRQKYPEIQEAFDAGRRPVDIEVENALLKSAMGYHQKIMKPIKIREEVKKDGVTKKRERIEMVEDEIYIQPNVAAQIFWLKNRKPERWKDRQPDDLGSDHEITINIVPRTSRDDPKDGDD